MLANMVFYGPTWSSCGEYEFHVGNMEKSGFHVGNMGKSGFHVGNINPCPPHEIQICPCAPHAVHVPPHGCPCREHGYPCGAHGYHVGGHGYHVGIFDESVGGYGKHVFFVDLPHQHMTTRVPLSWYQSPRYPIGSLLPPTRPRDHLSPSWAPSTFTCLFPLPFFLS